MFYEKKPEFFFIVRETNPLQYPLHLHQYIELVHVVKGLLEMHIGADKYQIVPGELALIFPNVLHDYHTLSAPGDTELHIMNCYLDLLPLHKNLMLKKRPVFPVLRTEQIHADVLYAKDRLFELSPVESSKALISSLVSLSLCRLTAALQLEDYQEHQPQDMTVSVIAYISEHYLEDLTLSSLASHFGIGKYALSRLFSNVLGCNFISYINSLRISYAEFLLYNTDMSIIRIAIESGFHNQQTFNRIFRQQHGCTPKEYRLTAGLRP